MSAQANYIFTVYMDVEADKEGIFNEVYDVEHIPLICKVPGVISAKRYKMEPLKVFLGGEVKSIVAQGEPQYMAIYELESADVLVGPGWSKAVDEGRWATHVRPYTKNRRHVLRKRIG